jgi:hypothetical protein
MIHQNGDLYSREIAKGPTEWEQDQPTTAFRNVSPPWREPSASKRTS